MFRRLPLLVAAAGLLLFLPASEAQFWKRKSPTPGPGGAPTQIGPQKSVQQLISKQPPLKINNSVLSRATPDNVHVVVSIPKQRAYLMVGDEIAADSPVSSGKRGHETPQGKFSVLEKDPDHKSTLYGDFADSSGRTVRAGVSAHIDAAPSGTHFVGAPMRWFMRLTDGGVGMHIGILPGYAASHGCVRMSSDGAKLFYDHVKVGTPVAVGDY